MDYDQLLNQVKELIEMQKKSQKQTDELIYMCKDALSIMSKNIDLYRNHRIEFVRNNSPFKNLSKDPAFFIHIVPNDYSDDISIDISKVIKKDILSYMFPLNCPGCDFKFNSDGYASFYNNSINKVQSYDQIIRNGVFESYFCVSYDHDNVNNKYIYEEKFLTSISKKIMDGISVLSNFSIKLPYNIYISLIDISNVYIIRISPLRNVGPFNVNKLYLPKFTFNINDNEDNVKSKLLPLLDIVWQTCGAIGYNK